MFYISTFELTLTCAVIITLFILPIIIKRSYAKMDRRIKELEDKVAQKKE